MEKKPSRKQLKELREAYCTKCLEWYNIKQDGHKHKGH